MKLKNILVTIFCSLTLISCIENDLPYPKVLGEILAISFREQVEPPLISSAEQSVNVKVEAFEDLTNLHIDSLLITEDATISPDPDSVRDFSSDVSFVISTYQDYEWVINVEKSIPNVDITSFEVDGQILSMIDDENKVITAILPANSNLNDLSITKFEYLPSEHTLSPNPNEITDLSDTVSFYFSELLEWKVIAQYETSMFTAFNIRGEISSHIILEQNKINVVMPSSSDLSNLEIENFEYLPSTSTVTPGREVTDFREDVTFVFEDGVEWIVSVSKEEVESEQVPFSDFTQWYMQGSGSRGYYLPGNDLSTPWRSGDKGAAEVMFPTFLHTVLPYPSFEQSQGATLESKMVLSVLAAGSLFTGEINGSGISNVVSDFGVPFTSRPESFTTTFTYEPKEYDNKMDECDIYVILQVRTGEGDNEKKYRLGTAWYRSSEENSEFQERTFSITYGELDGSNVYMEPRLDNDEMPEDGYYEDENADPTHIIVVFASSAHGASFEGAVGSKLVTKGIHLNY